MIEEPTRIYSELRREAGTIENEITVQFWEKLDPFDRDGISLGMVCTISEQFDLDMSTVINIMERGIAIGIAFERLDNPKKKWYHKL